MIRLLENFKLQMGLILHFFDASQSRKDGGKPTSVFFEALNFGSFVVTMRPVHFPIKKSMNMEQQRVSS